MSRFRKLISNIKHGEMSPRYYGRKDLEEYSRGVKKLTNMVPDRDSGFYLRGGTRYQADVTSFAVGSRGPGQIPFISTENEAYTIVINTDGVDMSTDRYFAVYKNDGTAATIVATFDLSSYTTAPLSTLDPHGFKWAQIADVMWVTHASGLFRPIIVSKISTDNDDFIFVDYSLTPALGFYGGSGLVNNLNIGRVNTALKEPYRDVNTTSVTMTPSATSGTGITITASSGFFTAEHVPCKIKITHGATTGVATIVGYTSATVVTADVNINFGATTASTNWEESAWSEARGYPRDVISHEQRLVWLGNISQPDTIWASQVGNPFILMQRRLAQDIASGADTSGINFFIDTNIPDDQKNYNGNVQVLLTQPFSFNLPAETVTPISWASSGRNLVIGTTTAEYVITGGSFDINNINIRRQTSYGGLGTRCISIDNQVLFIQRGGKSIRNFKYNEENGSYISRNIALTVEHLSRHGDDIFSEYPDDYRWKAMAHQKSEDIVWLLNSSNRLIGFRFSQENEMIAFYKLQFDTNDNEEDVRVFSMCCLPSASGSRDELWVVLERTIFNSTVYYLERVSQDFDGETLYDTNQDVESNQSMFLDCALKIDNTAATLTDTLTGLSHLEGETVTFVYRGVKIGEYEVVTGEISLDAAGQTAVDTAGIGWVGIEYEGTMESLDVNAGGDIGFSEGQYQRIVDADIRFHKTRAAKYGSIDSTEQNNTQYDVEFNHATTTGLSDEVKELNIPNSTETENSIMVKSSGPYPCRVLAINLLGETND